MVVSKIVPKFTAYDGSAAKFTILSVLRFANVCFSFTINILRVTALFTVTQTNTFKDITKH
jgi:hypothetical protein